MCIFIKIMGNQNDRKAETERCSIYDMTNRKWERKQDKIIEIEAEKKEREL